MIVGYDPERVEALATMSRQALWSLSTLTSTDPAAEPALQAVRRLHRTIETGVLAAADDIIGSDPLTCSIRGRETTGIDTRRRRDTHGSPTPTTSFRDLVREFMLRRLIGGLTLLSDDELLLLTRSELTTAAEAGRLLDIDDPDRLMRSTALGVVLSRRAAENPGFASRLVARSLDDPLLALVIAESDMSPEIKVAVFAATVSAEPERPQADHVRGRAVQRFLDQILDDPALALVAIGRSNLIADILSWGERDSTWVDLGVDDAVDLVDVAFSAASTYDLGSRGEPGASEVTARSLATLVDLMNSAHGDRGLPAELSAAYTAGILPLLPRFVHAFDGDEVFRLRRDDMSPVDVELGATSESMFDLLGGLARHRDSRAMLTGSVAALGPGIGTRYTAEQFAGFAAALGASIANEQHEETIHAGRQEDRWITGLTLLEAGIESSGVVARGTGAPVNIGFDIARWSVGHLVPTSDLDLDDAPRAIEMLLVVALTARIMRDIADDGGSDNRGNGRSNSRDNGGDDHVDVDHVGRVEAQLARIDERLSSPGVDATDIAGEIDLLRDLVDQVIESADLDAATRRRVAQVWSALDDDAFSAPPFRSETEPDLER